MIKLIKSTFYKEHDTKKKLCKFIMESPKLSNGDACIEFEKKFSKWQGRKHSVLFNSGSSANMALIQALLNIGELKKGDSVGFSGITWPTNIMPLMQLGLKVYPVDVETKTLNVSSRLLKAAHQKRKMKCFFLTNLLGFCDDIDNIKRFCIENNIIFLEDNCESLGSVYKKRKLGNFGLASTFSFFVGHHMSTIEGGMVCTDDGELDSMLRMVRSHGWDRNVDRRTQLKLRKQHKVDNFYGLFTFYDLAYNFRPTEIQGFLGITQLQFLAETIRHREETFKKLSAIYKNPDFYPVEVSMTTVSNFGFPLVCKSRRLRDKYIDKCRKAGIEMRPMVGGLMTEQPFYKKYISENVLLPNAKHIHNSSLYVGNNPDMTDYDIDFLIKTLSCD